MVCVRVERASYMDLFGKVILSTLDAMSKDAMCSIRGARNPVCLQKVSEKERLEPEKAETCPIT